MRQLVRGVFPFLSSRSAWNSSEGYGSRMQYVLFLYVILVAATGVCAAAPGDSLTVQEVYLIGHKKTRPRVIFREMTFGQGQRIAVADFREAVHNSYNNLMNTGLFVRADITYDTSQLVAEGRMPVIVNLKETWYIYPVPQFELADRNFNVWWNEQGRSLDRVNIGGKLTYYNFTGQRDRLRLGFTTGYTRSVEASYRFPYLNRAASIGLSTSFSHAQRREQNYLTRNNRQEFYADPDNFVYKRDAVEVALSYRRRIYVTHTVELGWRRASVADTIGRILNPEFFGGGRTSQRYFRLGYAFTNDRRDVRNYPWRGKYVALGIAKDGLGLHGERDGLEVYGDYRRFVSFGKAKRYSLNYSLAGKYSLIRTRQPFLENRAIGFGSNGLIGYQFYVVDGLDMLIWRLGLRRELLQTKLKFGKFVPFENFRIVPLRLLVNVQFNQGVANAPFVDTSNRLNNNLLTGMGAGIDVVLFFDMVAGIQYNRNHLGEGGVYLNLNVGF